MEHSCARGERVTEYGSKNVEHSGRSYHYERVTQDNIVRCNTLQNTKDFRIRQTNRARRNIVGGHKNKRTKKMRVITKEVSCPEDTS